jgi:hypothetical protein
MLMLLQPRSFFLPAMPDPEPASQAEARMSAGWSKGQAG